VTALPSSADLIDVDADEIADALGIPRLYRGVVWADVVADIAADAVVAS
jgi:hypothetical protein